jgi:hypothetical protein
MHQPQFAAVLGPVSFAAAPLAPAASAMGKSGAPEGKAKPVKINKAAKPKEALKPLANGTPAGKQMFLIVCWLTCTFSLRCDL